LLIDLLPLHLQHLLLALVGDSPTLLLLLELVFAFSLKLAFALSTKLVFALSLKLAFALSLKLAFALSTKLAFALSLKMAFALSTLAFVLSLDLAFALSTLLAFALSLKIHVEGIRKDWPLLLLLHIRKNRQLLLLHIRKPRLSLLDVLSHIQEGIIDCRCWHWRVIKVKSLAIRRICKRRRGFLLTALNRLIP
jgi:hypothetical protein